MLIQNENHKRHILLWDELSRTGDWQKSETFDKLFPEAKIPNFIAYRMSCWACEEAKEDCTKCPLSWREDSEGCMKENTLFTQWRESTNREERKILAALIRDLPWKEV